MISYYISIHPHRIKTNLHISKSLKCTINIQLCGLTVKILKIYHRILLLQTILMRLEALPVHYPQNGCLISQLHYKGDNSIIEYHIWPYCERFMFGLQADHNAVNETPEMMPAQQDVDNCWT